MSKVAKRVAGRVLGPRPGLAACSFPQGKVEIITRAVIVAVSSLAVAAGAAIFALKGNYMPSANGSLSNSTAEKQATGAAVLCIVAGGLTIIWELIMILLRFLNIGLLNVIDKIFLGIDVALGVLIEILLLSSVIVSAIISWKWYQLTGDGIIAVFVSLVASSVLAFFASTVLFFLVLFMIVFIKCDWNKKGGRDLARSKMAAMVASAAGEVVGPRPGKAACSFKQGIVEMVLRSFLNIDSFLTTVAGALILGFAANYSSDESGDTPSQTLVRLAGGLAIAAGTIAFVWETLMIVLRVLNIGLLNIKDKPFLGTDVAVGCIMGFCLLGAGIFSATIAADWSGISSSDAKAVFGSLVAAVVCAVGGALSAIILAIYMVVYIKKNWNAKVVKYTVKEAIKG